MSTMMSTIGDALFLVLQVDVLLATLLASIWPDGWIVPGPVGHDGEGALGAGHLLPVADRGHCHRHRRFGHGDLLRRYSRHAAAHSGTPASAAYADEAYAMTRKGEPELALGICVWFSALGGIAGTLSLMVLAPPLAEMALNFSTYEYFWLGSLGLMCATWHVPRR
jgi:putative tricarboxylic transport membrane protein